MLAQLALVLNSVTHKSYFLLTFVCVPLCYMYTQGQNHSMPLNKNNIHNNHVLRFFSKQKIEVLVSKAFKISQKHNT